MYLVDTNILLEIFLNQERKGECKKFLDTNVGRLFLSDFSLHSIGVILFRHKKHKFFRDFLEDAFNAFWLVELPADGYGCVVEAAEKYGLDFDDAYQVCVAKEYGLSVVTMDRDFLRVEDVAVKLL